MSRNTPSEERCHIDERSEETENMKHSNPYDVAYGNQDEKIGITETLKNIFFIIQMMVVLMLISHKLRDKR